MTRSSSFAKIIALSLAVVAHGALLSALAVPEATMIEGSDGAADVRLGNAFEDMSTGTLTAETSDTAEPVTTASEVTRERPDTITPEPTARAETAKPLEPVVPDRSAPTPSADQAKVVAALRPETTASVAPQVSVAVTPDGMIPASPIDTVEADQPELDEVPPETPKDRLESSEMETAAVASSARPKLRSADFVAARKPKPVTTPAPRRNVEPAPRPKQAQGNAQQNARAGEATGAADATARQSGSDGGQQATGNAAVSNYPGLVMRQLSRAGKPRVNARGAAVVAFTIGGNGGLASVAVARSSGSAALDQAAVQLVRSAGPFPEPPRGARRNFSIQIKGR